MVRRAIAGKHHHRPRRVPAHHDQVLEHIAARRVGVDDDHLRLEPLDGLQKCERRCKRCSDFVAGEQQSCTQHLGPLCRFIDHEHTHRAMVRRPMPRGFPLGINGAQKRSSAPPWGVQPRRCTMPATALARALLMEFHLQEAIPMRLAQVTQRCSRSTRRGVGALSGAAAPALRRRDRPRNRAHGERKRPPRRAARLPSWRSSIRAPRRRPA